MHDCIILVEKFDGLGDKILPYSALGIRSPYMIRIDTLGAANGPCHSFDPCTYHIRYRPRRPQPCRLSLRRKRDQKRDKQKTTETMAPVKRQVRHAIPE